MRFRLLTLAIPLLAGCAGDSTSDLADRPSMRDDLGPDPADLLPDPCANGVLDSDESDVDCGGTCHPCDDQRSCRVDGDCVHQVCIGGRCRPGPACDDGVKNGSESDVDCGGACPSCVLGKECRVNADCAGRLCRSNHCVNHVMTRLSFDAPVPYSPEAAPVDIATGDFNRDGRPDVDGKPDLAGAVRTDGVYLLRNTSR